MAASNPEPQGNPPGVPVDPPGKPPAKPLPQAPPVLWAKPLEEGRSVAKPSRKGRSSESGEAAAPALDVPSDEEERVRLGAFLKRNAPGWLVSTVFHTVLLILLGLVVGHTVRQEGLALKAVYAEKLGEQLELDTAAAGLDRDKSNELILTPDKLPPVEDPLAAPPDVRIVPEGTYATSKMTAPQVGLALQGREIGMKKALLGAYGGTATTEASVLAGLQWLAKNQERSGSWSLIGPYSDGAVKHLENRVAATAMALLAFQGAGNTHQSGQFKKNVASGWKWLLGQQEADGCFFREGPYVHRFYTQGQCTIALCELLGMTKDEEYRPPAEKAVKYLLDSQSDEGGWRYQPRMESDVSVTGWIVMALQSARMAGLEVPEENLRRVERFLDRVALEGGSRYPYRQGEEIKVSMTAEALLCRQYLGWKHDDPRLVDGVKFLTKPENLVDFGEHRDTYYWYYATQVCHHMEGQYWQQWNSVMRQKVPENQVKTGREAGSWDPIKPTRDPWEAYGGRLYVTCLSIYMLEVYYRHLPLYSKIYTRIQPEKP